MSHMLADTLEELHAMAAAIGLRRARFQNHGTPHYDLCQAKRAIAISLGAVIIDRRATVELIRKLREDGIAPPRRAAWQVLNCPACVSRSHLQAAAKRLR